MSVTIDQEFRALIPPLTGEEREQLEKNLLADGCRDPLVIWAEGGNILMDGHNRHEICTAHKIAFHVVPVASRITSRDEALTWIILNQLGKRNLAPFCRCELALKLGEIIERSTAEICRTIRSENRTDSSASSESWLPVTDYPNYSVSNHGRVRKSSGEMVKQTITPAGYLSVSLASAENRNSFLVHRLVASAFIPNSDSKPQVHHKNANRDDNHADNLEWATASENVIYEKAEKKRAKLAAVRKVLSVSADTIAKAEKIAAKADEATKAKLRTGEATINSAYNDIRREEKKDEHQARVEAAQSAPKDQEIVGPFDLILADPPWKYEHCEANNREIENHYNTAPLAEIFSHRPDAKDDSILFLWATAPKLAEAIAVMDQWGYSYRSCAVWDKTVIGMGYWFRIQHELLLVGTRGDAKATPESVRRSSIFSARRGEHSAKPDCVYEWIESAFPEAKKLEMYCRKPRAGWAAWGNEV